jgi:superfamily II DNA or RNA helicase
MTVLRPYQESTIQSLLTPPEGVTRSLAVLATGSGKTVIFSAFLNAFLKSGQRALVLAHRTELLEQARQKLAVVSPTLHVELEANSSRASKKISGWSKNLKNIDRSVVVASIQSMKGKRLAAWAPDTFQVVIIDEAHHSVAAVYVDLLKHFGCMDGKTRLVGVTATPGRTDNVGLGFVYQQIAADYGIRELIKLGWLCPLTARRVTSMVSLEGIKTSHGDFVASDLERRVDVANRNELIISALEEHAPGEQTIIFTTGVAHALHVAELARARGISAAAIWGDMPKEDRLSTLAAYHAGTVQVLVNFAVLTEGFDAPNTSCIILARPTKSSLIIAQCIGRGTRISPGKERCLVLDIRDCVAGKNLATAASLAGLPPNFDAEGKNLIELAEEIEALPEPLKKHAIDLSTLSDFVGKIKKGMSAEEISLFIALEENPSIKSRSSLAWQETAENTWRIAADNAEYVIGRNSLNRYIFTRNGEVIAAEGDPTTAFTLADSWMRAKHPEAVKNLLENSVQWRAEKATPAQIKLIRRMSKGQEVPKDLTKGQAGRLISARKTSFRNNRTTTKPKE